MNVKDVTVGDLVEVSDGSYCLVTDNPPTGSLTAIFEDGAKSKGFVYTSESGESYVRKSVQHPKEREELDDLMNRRMCEVLKALSDSVTIPLKKVPENDWRVDMIKGKSPNRKQRRAKERKSP